MKNMAKAMKRMGIQQTELEAKQVIIRFEDKELIFTNPQVSKVNMMGQETYQIIGEPEEKNVNTTPDLSEDDIQTVMDQTGKSHDEAKTAIQNNNGDLAAAIIELKQ